MRISTRVVIEMCTGRIIEKDNLDYEGPVAECKGGGGGVSYVQSPEARKMYEAMLPAVQTIAQAGERGDTLYNVPGMRTKGLYNYDLPDPSMLMPTQGWWGNIDPGIKAGIQQPWLEAGDALRNQLNSMGQLGSMRGGASGIAGRAYTDLASEAAMQMPMQAWQMMQPGLQTAYQSQLQRSMFGAQQALTDKRAKWQAQIASMRMPYEIIPGMAGGSMPQPVVTSGGGK